MVVDVEEVDAPGVAVAHIADPPDAPRSQHERHEQDPAQRWAGPHRLLSNKYYVDEIYNAVFVQPIKRVSETGLWKVVDAGLIDGIVNGVGLTVRGWSAVLRRVQTGSVRAYAMSIFVGVVAILGYYLWR